MRLKEEEATADKKKKKIGGFPERSYFSNESNISKDYDMWKQKKERSHRSVGRLDKERIETINIGPNRECRGVKMTEI